MLVRANEFFSQLHTVHLKPMGFRKTRHTFFRAGSEVTECIQFQGSAWNDRDSPWRFYVNFGVLFRDLPPRHPDRDFPRTHCWARIDSLVPGAHRDFDLAGDTDQLASSLAELVEQASRMVHGRLDRVRERYTETLIPWFTLE